MWPYMAPKGTQFEPKGYKHDPKGCQKDAKSEPEINKNTTKKHNLERSRKRGGAGTSFGVIFDLFLLKKCVQKSKRKTMEKNTSKNLTFKQKTRHDPTPKNRDSQFFLQSRFLQNNVFTWEKQCFLKIPCFENVHTFEEHHEEKVSKNTARTRIRKTCKINTKN